MRERDRYKEEGRERNIEIKKEGRRGIQEGEGNRDKEGGWKRDTERKKVGGIKTQRERKKVGEDTEKG